MTSFTSYCNIGNISNWCRPYMFTTRPPWRDPYYVNWYTHKVHWCKFTNNLKV